MQLFYAPEIAPPNYTLSEEESKHAIRVLRLALGDDIDITDGRGNLFHCRIVDANHKRCSVEVIECSSEHEKLPYRLVMGVAPTKSIERFEWYLEKATEVGISEIYPLLTAHSERKAIKAEREEKVISSAMKQSLKAYHPTLHPMLSVREIICTPFEGEKYIAHCAAARSTEGKRPLHELLARGESSLILIGPEGDFSPEEIELAVENGFHEITLGTQRLRSETAAVMVAVIAATKNM